MSGLGEDKKWGVREFSRRLFFKTERSGSLLLLMTIIIIMVVVVMMIMIIVTLIVIMVMMIMIIIMITLILTLTIILQDRAVWESTATSCRWASSSSSSIWQWCTWCSKCSVMFMMMVMVMTMYMMMASDERENKLFFKTHSALQTSLFKSARARPSDQRN